MTFPLRARRSAGRRLGLVLIPLALLSACSGAVSSRSAVDQIPLEADAFLIDGVTFGRNAAASTVIVATRLEERGGKAVLCGAYLTRGDFQLLDFDFRAEILRRSEVYFDDLRLLSDLDGFTGPLPWGAAAGMEVNCLPTELAWKPEFADFNRLRVEFPEKIRRAG